VSLQQNPTAPLSLATVRRVPKVLLHDHLDGGLRPGTIIDLADQAGYPSLPSTDVEELGRWFREAADSGSLERYLETFAHTVGVMQSADALERVAAECAQDLAADGVVYAEVRFAPELHTQAGLTHAEVVEAVLAGFRKGSAAAAEAGTPIRLGTLLTAMRSAARSSEIAGLAVRYRHEGVVGFDIAGAEAGFPPTRTSTPSSTSAARTPTSPSTPARVRACPRSGRRSSGAAPTGSVTGSGSSTTSRSARTVT
jgi:adenosine deaminase